MIGAAWAVVWSVVTFLKDLVGWVTLAWLAIGFGYAYLRHRTSQRAARAAARQIRQTDREFARIANHLKKDLPRKGAS
ncbi:hypothetical protein ACIBG8_07400 [Nonomuraea sp. NPDC050556]|uniref:hypothetical protein n=1 Tax=Nonomuraea sp. NPDC050556 TaxID=3364369 RepID=UPI0037909972